MQKLNKIIKYFSINSSRSMDWKKLVSIAVFLFFASCISFYHHPKGGFRPKNPKFSLAEKVFFFNKAIDTNSIYIKTDTTKYGNYRRLSFLKFYNNGRIFKSNKSVEEKLSYDNFRPLDIGYYVTRRDSIIIENFIVNPSNKYDTEYVILNGIIKGDSIIINNRFIKGDKDIYIKQKLDFIPEPSNW